MKAVLLSVQPKWCELIANGIKTVEVRKTKPNLKTPFKVYIYCTKPKEHFSLGGGLYACSDLLYRVNEKIYCGDGFEHYNSEIQGLNGKVIGEFICNEIEYFDYGIQIPYEATHYLDCYEGYPDWPQLVEQSQVPLVELLRYGNKKGLFGWSISDLISYEEPKELSEFMKPCIDKYGYCQECKYGFCKYPEWVEMYEDLEGCCFETECLNTVTKAPNSWCYVEEMRGKN